MSAAQRRSSAVHRSRAAAVLALVVLLLALAATSPATAQRGGDEDPVPAQVSLTALDAVVDPQDAEAAITAELRLDPGPHRREDLRLVTTVYTRTADREALRDAVAGELPTVFSASSELLPDMAPGSSRVLTSTTPAQDLALLGASRAGVYPVTLEVFEGPDPIGVVRTSVVVLPEDAPAPIPATTVVRFPGVVPPLRGDTPDASVDALLAPGGPLDVATADVAGATAGSGAGVVLAVDGRLIEDLHRLADGHTRPDGTAVPPEARASRRAGAAADVLAAAAGRGDVEALAYPYATADLVALVRGGLTERALELLADGPVAASSQLSAPVTSGVVLPPDGLDAATLAAVGSAGADAVLLDASYVTSADVESFEPVRRLRTADGGEVRVLVPDPVLSALTRDLSDLGTAAVVQQVLAESATAWMAGDDGPSRSQALLLALDPLEGTSPGLVTALTDAVAAAPWLRPVNLGALRTAVTPSTRLVRLAYPPRSAASELPASYIDRLGQAHEALGPLAALLPADDPLPGRLAESLRVAASTAYRDPDLRSTGDARSREALQRLATVSGAVEILESPPVTLTATTGEVPVTVRNTGEVPLRLRATLTAARFAFPEGSTQTFTLDPQSSQRLIFHTQSLNPGGFAPISVTVDDPSVGLVVARTRMSVRSTAFPVVGLLAMVGSALVLVTWGVRQGRRRRPGRHERGTDRPASVA